LEILISYIDNSKNDKKIILGIKENLNKQIKKQFKEQKYQNIIKILGILFHKKTLINDYFIN